MVGFIPIPPNSIVPEVWSAASRISSVYPELSTRLFEHALNAEVNAYIPAQNAAELADVIELSVAAPYAAEEAAVYAPVALAGEGALAAFAAPLAVVVGVGVAAYAGYRALEATHGNKSRSGGNPASGTSPQTPVTRVSQAPSYYIPSNAEQRPSWLEVSGGGIGGQPRRHRNVRGRRR